MARELPVLSQQATESPEFRYVDWAKIIMPLKFGDGQPIILHSAKAAFLMAPIETPEWFVIEVYLAGLDRMPSEVEFDAAMAEFDSDDIAHYISDAQAMIAALFTDVYPNASKSDYQFLTDSYGAFFGRFPVVEERAAWQDDVGEGEPLDRPNILSELKSTAEFIDRITHNIQPREFNPEVKSMSALTINEGRAMDNVSMVIVNREEQYSTRFSDDFRPLSPARAIVGRAFYVGSEVFESDVLMIGAAQIDKIDMSEISITALSDTSRQGIRVVKEITQRCAHIYKGPGCDTQDSSPTCSRIKDDSTNGCASKDPAPQLTGDGLDDNRPSFLGVIKGAPHPGTPIGINPDDPPWGTGIGHAPCFLDGTEVTLKDGSKIVIELTKEGIWIQCPYWNGKYLTTKFGMIREVRWKWVDEYYEMTSEAGVTRVVPDHRYFSVAKKDYVALRYWEDSDRTAVQVNGIWHPRRILERKLRRERVKVWNLSVIHWETFIANDHAVHNTKILPIENPV